LCWIEKEGLSTPEMLGILCAALSLPREQLGTAGLKDKHAITRQQVSLPAVAAAALASFSHPQVRVLEVARHDRKLKTGHLRGNRFVILARDVAVPPDTSCVARGIPNRYGAQRLGDAVQDGMRMLRGERLHLGTFQRRFALSAAQSFLFNDCLARRDPWTILRGDVLEDCRLGTHAWAGGQERVGPDAYVATGPMYGPHMRSPRGEVAALERAVLDAAGLTPEAFERFGRLTRGTRRPLLVWPRDFSAAAEAGGWRLRFALPAGAYATEVTAALFADRAESVC
jgi:tRNA pseudouridine13 synthase